MGRGGIAGRQPRSWRRNSCNSEVLAIAEPTTPPDSLSPRPTRGEGEAVEREWTLGSLTAARRFSLSPSEGERAGVRGLPKQTPLTPTLSPRPTRGEGGAVERELTLGSLTAARRSSLSPSEGERAGVRGQPCDRRSAAISAALSISPLEGKGWGEGLERARLHRF